METTLFLAHTEADGTLAKPALEALSAAKTLTDATLVAGLFGESVEAGANQIANAGASKILGVAGADFAQPRYATDAAAAEALAKAAGATVVIAPATSRLSRVLAGVAHRLGGRIDTHVTALAATPTISRWYYRQRMVAEITRAQRPWIITIDPGSFPLWSGEPGTASVEAVSVESPAARTEVTGVQAPDTGEQTINPDADLLFVAGAGWTKKQADGQVHVADAEKHILGLLHGASASLGSSKSLVDLSSEGEEVFTFMTHLNQIGQTGATPRHPKGLATCCHGEEPHVVGWRFVNERRAVNLDAGCGWAQGKTDVLYVADAFEVMEKVNALLASG